MVQMFIQLLKGSIGTGMALLIPAATIMVVMLHQTSLVTVSVQL